MKDPRITKLAYNLVNYSCRLNAGERVLIEDRGIAPEMTCALIEAAYAAGALPLVALHEERVERALLMGATREQMELMAKYDAERMRDCQAYIGIRGGANQYSSADVPAERKQLYLTHYSKVVHGGIRVPSTRWVVLRYPTPSMAQQAGMSTEAFEDYYFDVCCMDYGKMSAAMDALVDRMQATDKVHILGKGTDLSFSIKGLPAIKCDGQVNIPDGEVFSAPVKGSVNGVISFNTPSVYQGQTHERVVLTFENGRIVKADSSLGEQAINAVFDTDAGARYVGEFAIGVNPYITFPMKDILFDEKIAGSFHFTPGMCYDECNNGNKSAIHWDLICIQRPEYGGGEIWFDDELVRKDGLFVPESLKGLNPDQLKA